MTKEILFLTCVHGNENFSISILRKLEKEFGLKKFDWLIANQKAVQKKTRFIDADLNRVAPGKEYSKKYEVRRAYQLLEICKNYKYVIDIHGTNAKTGIFIIITNPKKKNIKLASLFLIKNIVIWGDKKVKLPGPLTRFIDNAIEIECGPKNLKKIKLELYNILKNYLLNKGNHNSFNQQVYKVYGRLSKDEMPIDLEKRLKEFKLTTIQREKFYPLLIGRYKEIISYKMVKVEK